jgi:hypothetical protein
MNRRDLLVLPAALPFCVTEQKPPGWDEVFVMARIVDILHLVQTLDFDQILKVAGRLQPRPDEQGWRR